MDKRVKGLQAEYRTKARDADQGYGGVEKGQVGPVERKLEQFGKLQGFVFGAFAECSDDVHDLVRILAGNRLKFEALQSGVVRKKERLGEITAQIRRNLSIGVVKGQAESLLARLNQIGSGTKKAAERRQVASFQAEKLRREAQAQWIGDMQGRKVLRRGFFKLD